LRIGIDPVCDRFGSQRVVTRCAHLTEDGDAYAYLDCKVKQILEVRGTTDNCEGMYAGSGGVNN
jgi:hypothetical protein